ncbi:MAG: proton-conducting membrane transporter [Halobacteriota archaeon]
MTSRPELKLGSHLLPGLAAVALFAVMAVAFMRATFGDPQGFADGANITASIGYAMFDLDLGDVPAEGFLVAFITIAIVLDVALDGALHLAKREGEVTPSQLVADGGRVVRDALGVETGDDETTEGEN